MSEMLWNICFQFAGKWKNLIEFHMPHRNEDRCVASAESWSLRVQLPPLKVALNNNNNYRKYVCKVYHQSKSSSVPQRAAQITFAASAAARPHTHSRTHTRQWQPHQSYAPCRLGRWLLHCSQCTNSCGNWRQALTLDSNLSLHTPHTVSSSFCCWHFWMRRLIVCNIMLSSLSLHSLIERQLSHHSSQCKLK